METRILRTLGCALVLLALGGCATESYQALPTAKPISAGTPYAGPRGTLMVGKFDNRSAYMRVLTSEIIYSVQGAGEYALSNREVLGFGGTAGYDSTLNGKVLDLAIREAIDRLVDGLQDGKWRVTR